MAIATFNMIDEHFQVFYVAICLETSCQCWSNIQKHEETEKEVSDSRTSLNPLGDAALPLCPHFIDTF